MPTITLTLPRLHPVQAAIKQEARRFNVVNSGRRFGKTILGVDVLTSPVLHGYPVAWFSPTYKMLAEVWRDLCAILQPVTARTNTQEKRLELVTGGVVEMWSLEDPNAGRSRKYKAAVIDEAAMTPNLEPAWNAAIRPTLTDLSGGAWFLSTPKGYNFFHALYQRGQGADPDWASWTRPTADNPHIPAAEIAAAEAELPALIFRQEYLADFSAGAELGVFRGVREVSTLAAGDPAAHQGHTIVSGLDFAQAADFTVHSVGCATCRQQLQLDRFNRMEWALARGRIRAGYDKWGVSVIYAEKNSIGGPNIEAMQAEGMNVIPFDTTATSKPPLIQSWALAIERKEWALLSDVVQVGEHESYQMTPSKVTGRPTYSAPAGGHDDIVIAAALMNQAALLGAGFGFGVA